MRTSTAFNSLDPIQIVLEEMSREIHRVKLPENSRNDANQTCPDLLEVVHERTRVNRADVHDAEHGEHLAADNRRLRADQYSFLRFWEDLEVSQVRSRNRTTSFFLFLFLFFFSFFFFSFSLERKRKAGEHETNLTLS